MLDETRANIAGLWIKGTSQLLEGSFDPVRFTIVAFKRSSAHEMPAKKQNRFSLTSPLALHKVRSLTGCSFTNTLGSFRALQSQKLLLVAHTGLTGHFNHRPNSVRFSIP